MRWMQYYFTVIFVVVFVNFSQLTYNASEGSEMAEVDIRFSNPSSTAITVQVTNRDISANSRGTCFTRTCAFYF